MLELHHIGCLVDNIEESVQRYKRLFKETQASEIVFISAQQVNVCFVKVPIHNVFLELIESKAEDSVISKLKNKGFTYYHLGYYVKDMQKTIETLEDENFKFINTFTSEAFNNKKCSFLMSPEMHLIELIEK